MTATRLPALSKAGIDTKKAKPGGRGVDLEGVLPDTDQLEGAQLRPSDGDADAVLRGGW